MLKIDNFFARINIRSKNILAGFSGGADSTALLVLMHESSVKVGYRLTAVHFDHGLRGVESLKDAEWCKKFCEIRRIPFLSFKLEVPRNMLKGESIEEAARRLRLEKWKELVKDTDAVIALGHNSNDRIENVMLRLFRGSNASGLTSMRELQELDGLRIIRPILNLKRAEIEDFLKSRGISDWCKDRTNRENIYKRNLLRNDILPRISKGFQFAEDGVLKACSALEMDAGFIEGKAHSEFKKVSGSDILPLRILKLHPALLIRVLRYWITERTGAEFIPDWNLMERLDKELAKFAGRRKTELKKILIPLKDGGRLLLDKNGLSISVEKTSPASQPGPLTWDLKKESEFQYAGYKFTIRRYFKVPRKLLTDKSAHEVCFDADSLPEKLILRMRRPGDRMIPFGAYGEVRLKKIFENAKMPSAQSARTPLVCTPEGTIIWIPGVRRANFANINFRKCEKHDKSYACIISIECSPLLFSNPDTKFEN